MEDSLRYSRPTEIKKDMNTLDLIRDCNGKTHGSQSPINNNDYSIVLDC